MATGNRIFVMYKEHNVRTSPHAGWTAFQTVSGRRWRLIGMVSTGHSPRRSARAQDQRVHQAAEQRGIRAVGGERQSDPGGGFLDPHRHLEQLQPNGGNRVSASLQLIRVTGPVGRATKDISSN